MYVGLPVGSTLLHCCACPSLSQLFTCSKCHCTDGLIRSSLHLFSVLLSRFTWGWGHGRKKSMQIVWQNRDNITKKGEHRVRSISKYWLLIFLFFMETIKCNWSHQRHNWNLYFELNLLRWRERETLTLRPRIAVPKVVNLENVNKGTFLG